MSVTGFDHVAVPVARPEEMMLFYRALGFQAPTPEEWRASGARVFAVQFGNNKINMHTPVLWQNPAFTLRGHVAQPGCGDFCFVWGDTLQALKETLARVGAPIELGPVERVGGGNGGRARGMSIYTRDPDDNLLEFIVYGQPA